MTDAEGLTPPRKSLANRADVVRVSPSGRARPPEIPLRASRGRRGNTLVFATALVTTLFAFVSLAVDFGRMQAARAEMRQAVDAAALAAAKYLPSDTTGARSAAVSFAAANSVDGSPLVLLTSDVVVGKWDATNKTLDTASATPDAVRITGVRSAARGTAVSLNFARLLGRQSVDLSVTATAWRPATASYGLVGLNWFNMNAATAHTGTYDSSTATFTTGTASNDGSIACNGNMNLNAAASIGGTIYYNTASAPNGGANHDGKVKMASAIATPATPSPGAYATTNSNHLMGLPPNGGNVNTSSGAHSIPAGTYYVNSFNLTGGTITFTGPATVYVNGNVTISGSGRIVTHQNRPANLQIKVCVAAGFNYSSSHDLYAQVDCPSSPMNHGGSGDVIGSVMATGIDMSGTGGLYFDRQLGTNGASSAATSLVR